MSNLREIYEKSMKVESEKIEKERANRAHEAHEHEMLDKGLKRLAEILTDAGFRATQVDLIDADKRRLSVTTGAEFVFFHFKTVRGVQIGFDNNKPATWNTWFKSLTPEHIMLSYDDKAYDMDSEAEIRKLAGEIVEDFGSEIARKRMVTRQP